MDALSSPKRGSRESDRASPSSPHRGTDPRVSDDEEDDGRSSSISEDDAVAEDLRSLGSSDAGADVLSALDRENALFDVVVKMRASLGGGKHRRRFTNHRNCFTGRQAVQWLVSSGAAEDADEAVKLGNELMAAKLIVGVTKAGRNKFEKRSHLYTYHLGVAPGIYAAKYYVSTEIMAMEAKMKMVRRVVDGHTSVVEALSREHAGTMENVDRLIATLKLELSILRSGVVALVVYALLPFFKTDAEAIARAAGASITVEVVRSAIAVIAGAAVVGSSLFSALRHFDLARRMMLDAKRGDDQEERAEKFPTPRDRRSLDQAMGVGSKKLERTPSSFLQASAQTLQRTASRLMHLGRPTLRPEERAGPPPTMDPAIWVDSPIALRFSPADAMHIQQENQLQDNIVRAQVPFEIDSELFKGKMVVYLRGLDNAPDDIFAGKARTIQLAIQGKFKRECAMDEVVIGQVFARALHNLPSKWLLALCVRVVRGYGEIWGVDLSMPTDEKPFMLAPMAMAAQAMSCEKEGDVQDIEGAIIENVDLRSDIFPPGTTPRIRQKILKQYLSKSRKGECEMPTFDTEHVWTFGFWQAQINFLSYKLDLGVGVFNLLKIVKGQPLTFCASSKRGEILFRMEIWHKEIMREAQQQHGEKERAKQRSRRASLDFPNFAQRVDGAVASSTGF